MRVRIVRLGLLALAVAAAAPGVARAVNTCNGLITIDYVTGPNFVIPGDVVRVRLTLGTGSIQGGTKLTVNRVRFDLDCNSGFPLVTPCTDEGMIIMCFVSPCDRNAACSRSPCEVRVGRPVDGPTRCTSKITAGVSA